jgi:DNA-binding FadR family transcriptional regulator
VAHLTSSAVRIVAEKLRTEVLSRPDWSLLGSEDELLTRYAISRPTLRQAASMLIQEQLLAVRRGHGGGYFARHPDIRGVVHSSAIYLMAHGISMNKVIDAIVPIKASLAALACQNKDPELRRKLQEVGKAAIPETGLYWAYLKNERAFARILGEMAGNEVLSLFLNTLYEFCGRIPPGEDVYVNHPDRIRTYLSARDRMIQAILDSDAQVAAIQAERCASLVASWMQQDIEQSSSSALGEVLSITSAAESA